MDGKDYLLCTKRTIFYEQRELSPKVSEDYILKTVRTIFYERRELSHMEARTTSYGRLELSHMDGKNNLLQTAIIISCGRRSLYPKDDENYIISHGQQYLSHMHGVNYTLWRREFCHMDVEN